MNHLKKTILLIGAGAIGLRHLEGVLKARLPLRVTVVDPSSAALTNARAVPVPKRHHVAYETAVPQGGIVDLAIVATTSHHRANVVRELLRKTKKVRYIVLEKILFDRKEDYAAIERLLARRRVKAWLNSPVPMFPFHRRLKQKLGSGPIFCHFSGGERFGLMTTAVHDAHYASYLAGTPAFTADTSLFVPHLIKAKRAGFSELHGTIALHFKNGSRSLSTTLPQSAPRRTTIMGKAARAIIEQPENGAWVAEKKHGWKWKRVGAPFLLQSEMTGPLVERILRTGACDLPTFTESAQVHLQILEPVQKFLRMHGYRGKNYPFT